MTPCVCNKYEGEGETGNLIELEMIKKRDLNKITELFCFEKFYFRKLLVLPSRTSMNFGFATAVSIIEFDCVISAG